jgi:hypothetical protein
MKRCYGLAIGLWLVVAGAADGADQIWLGRIVRVEPDNLALLVQTDAGPRVFHTGVRTKFIDTSGDACKEGLRDKRFKPGARVKVVSSTTSATIKELYLLGDAAKTEDGKEDKGTSKPPAKDKSGAKDAGKGVAVRLLAVDAGKGTMRVQTADGKTWELTCGDKTQFLGPRGGASPKGLKDERLTEGAEFKIEFDAATKEVKVVHLPVRKGSK